MSSNLGRPNWRTIFSQEGFCLESTNCLYGWLNLVDAKNPEGIDLFLDIIEKAYLGSEFQYNNQTFRLEPTLVMPADFQRRIVDTHTSYESLLKALILTLKLLQTAKSIERKQVG